MEDKIGRQDLLHKVSGLITSLQDDYHMCISINGEWGSGKSYFLNLLEEDLKSKDLDLIIRYDAWENSFYSDPLIAILSCILDEISSKIPITERAKSAGKTATKEIADVAIQTTVKVVNSHSPVKIPIDLVEDFKQKLIDVVQAFKNPISNDRTTDFISYKSLLKSIKLLLEKITKKNRLIILVDELDRCLPDQQLVILERLHHLLDIKNCCVVIAMNMESIVKTINKIYGVDGYEYLRKFFDFSFILKKSSEDYLKSLLQDILGHVESLGIPESDLNNLQECLELLHAFLCYGDKHAVEKLDNRELFKISYIVNEICTDYGWEKINAKKMFFIIISLIIRRCNDNSFLDEEAIIMNQNKVDPPEPFSHTVYYDYFDEFIGSSCSESIIHRLDRDNIRTFNRLINSYANSFNMNVYGSLKTSEDEYSQLRNLIIMYAGEREPSAN